MKEQERRDRLAAIGMLDLVPQTGSELEAVNTTEARADRDTWQLVLGKTGEIMAGTEPTTADKEADPDLYAVCYLMVVYLRKRRRKYIGAR